MKELFDSFERDRITSKTTPATETGKILNPEQEPDDIILAGYRDEKAEEKEKVEILCEFIKSIIRGTSKTELEEQEEEHEGVIKLLANDPEIREAFENYRDKRPMAEGFDFGALIRGKIEELKKDSSNI